MKVTEEMLRAAMEVAVKSGLVQKTAGVDDYLRNWNGMKQSLQAALDVAQQDSILQAVFFCGNCGAIYLEKVTECDCLCGTDKTQTWREGLCFEINH